MPPEDGGAGPSSGAAVATSNGVKRKQDEAALFPAPPAATKLLKKNNSTASSGISADDMDDLIALPPATPPMSPYTSCFKPTVDLGTKYIVVSGGVCSSLGKGVTTSSIGALLRGEGYHVTAIKMDPYLNPDAGLMSPFEHGEVYVLDDGGETDLDLGNYERMMGLSLARGNNITTGKIYQHVIEKERRGDYLGKTVQVVPHITGAIVEWVDAVAQRPVDGSDRKPQICLIELGGTVGDIESMPFIEALRAFKTRLMEKSDEKSFAWVHCSYVPEMCGQKTKPTQHSVKALLAAGIQADFVVCRCAQELEEGTRKKIANQCNIASNRIISAHDQKNLFHVVRVLAEQRIIKMLESTLELEHASKERIETIWDKAKWGKFASKVDEAQASKPLIIGVVGKYIKGGEDAYQSLVCALHHAAVQLTRKLEVRWIDATELEGSGQRLSETEEQLRKCDGILVPGGFGDRGINGKAHAAHLARIWKKPYLGICLGMQVALIQFARDVLGYADATSEEFDGQKKSKHHIFEFMPEISKDTMGSNMRLGARWVEFPRPEQSFCCALYGGPSKIKERHRHRYEFNTAYKKAMEDKGLLFAGQDEMKERMDIVELPQSEHPFYLGVQFHPEYKSRPGLPSPPFYGFMAAACSPETLQEVLSGSKAQGPKVHWVPPDV